MNRYSCFKQAVATLTDHTARWLSSIALLIIAAYRAVLSPVLCSIWGPACRFQPTCSAYTAEAIGRYGIINGGWMALKRIMRCRPLGGWGFDPVPAACGTERAT